MEKNNKISNFDKTIRDETFDMKHEDIRQLGYQAVDLIVDYFKNVQDDPIVPLKTYEELKELIDEPLPKTEQDPYNVLSECKEKIIDNAMRTGHPRLLGWILPSGTIIGAFADGIASALNQNVAVSDARMATTVELLVINWIKRIIGYNHNAAGILVSGGSMANLTALAVARNIKADYDIHTNGMKQYEQNKKMMLYVSDEVHVCITKAASVLGIGTNNIRWIKTDRHFCLDTNELEKKITNDQKQGYHPFAVVASAGTVNTGTIDPLNSIADICSKHDLWFHVDAAYGGFAMVSSRLKPFLKGITRADSIALDPHKWLFIPFEAGCVLVKKPEHMTKTFATNASYIYKTDKKSFPDNKVDFSDYGLQLSRQFRALKIWTSLKQYGIKKYERVIDQNVYLSKYLEALVNESSDFEVVSSANLSIVCFRYYPKDLQREYQKSNVIKQEKIEKYLDTLNQAVFKSMLKDQRVLLSSTVLKNKFVLRACIVNYRTKKQDIITILEILRKLGAKDDKKLRETNI